ncbi:hypothetical protein CR513_23532, partial [Mucuna pruriens]
MVVEFRLNSVHSTPIYSQSYSPSSRWCTILQWRFSRSRKRRSRIERLKVVGGDPLTCHHTLVGLILNALANRGEPSPLNHGDCHGQRIHRIHTLSSSDPLYDLDPEIEITLRRLRKARNIVVSNSSNFVSSSDNSSPLSNNSNFVECRAGYTKHGILTLLHPVSIIGTNSDIQVEIWGRSSQALEGIPCGLFHNEVIGDTGRLHQEEGIPILPRWSSKRLAVSTCWRRKYVGSGNMLEKLYMNIGKYSRSFVPHVHIIKSTSNY